MGCASSRDAGNGDNRGITSLVEARQLITAQIADPELRAQLLHLAGSKPQTWQGCSSADIVPVLLAELRAEPQKPVLVQQSLTEPVKVQDAAPSAAVTQPAVQYVPVAHQPAAVVVAPTPMYVHRPLGPGLGQAVLTGVVAGRVAGRTAARRRRR